MSAMPPPQVEMTSECTILLRFGESIERSCNDRVHAALRALNSPPIGGVIALVPAYASLSVQYDPAEFTGDSDNQSPAEKITAALLGRLSHTPDGDTRIDRSTVQIPVCYDPSLGEDLNPSSRTLGISVDELIARHTNRDYQVAMLGFAPGFPYLLGLDPRLHMQRRSQPRLRVPAGSVAIGGAQTGIYPTDLPGGWQLIGRTPLRLFDSTRQPPQLMNAGDPVRFIAISREQFNAMTELDA